MGIHPYTIDYPIPPAVGQHSQPVILKVPETKGSPRYHLHLVVETFGDAIGLAEAPHRNDGCHPAGHRITSYNVCYTKLLRLPPVPEW